MRGWRWHSPRERLEIGRDVLDARAAGIPWKVLERRHSLTRQQLRKYENEAGAKVSKVNIRAVATNPSPSAPWPLVAKGSGDT